MMDSMVNDKLHENLGAIHVHSRLRVLWWIVSSWVRLQCVDSSAHRSRFRLDLALRLRRSHAEHGRLRNLIRQIDRNMKDPWCVLMEGRTNLERRRAAFVSSATNEAYRYANYLTLLQGDRAYVDTPYPLNPQP